MTNAILAPVMVLMLITILVWMLLFVRRLNEVMVKRINAQDLATPEQVTALLSERAQAPANCLKNLFELPVLFYALVSFLLLTGKVDGLYINLAWGFVILRSLQALVHCTYNRVQHRFFAYIAGSLILWGMIIRFALSVI